MKEIVVISGKGGTGKTSVTASFAVLGGGDIVTADCDVDAADMHMLMDPDFAVSEEFMSGELAVIDHSLCSQCGKCARVCRFDAIDLVNGRFRIDPVSCEGCGYCARICPEKAISMQEQKAGDVYISTTKTDAPMVHAKLGTNAENSGRLVAKVKNEAKRIALETGRNIVLVDGSPGIGCPVVSSLSGADYIIFVTEPTVSGLHDLKRVNELRKIFDIPAGCIINKSDLNSEMAKQITDYLDQEGIQFIGNIPYDESFTKAMTNRQTIVEYDGSETGRSLSEYWKTITEQLMQGEK
ncbi:MAG: ATP-binding protein [Spirochaetales bacterium]|nr:ATP-binding protein [Spirochaetales bacterium]